MFVWQTWILHKSDQLVTFSLFWDSEVWIFSDPDRFVFISTHLWVYLWVTILHIYSGWSSFMYQICRFLALAVTRRFCFICSCYSTMHPFWLPKASGHNLLASGAQFVWPWSRDAVCHWASARELHILLTSPMHYSCCIMHGQGVKRSAVCMQVKTTKWGLTTV